MIRVAYLLALLALATIFPLVLDLSGQTAILFVFVGFPVLAVAIVIFVIEGWRVGGFTSPRGRSGRSHRT